MIFVVTGFRYGWRSVAGAVVAEALFRILVSGFYGAIAQRLTRLRSRWKVVLMLVFVLPVAEQLIDYAIHRRRGTPNLGWAMVISCGVMAISALFNWYVMTHGVLLTGAGTSSLLSDLRRMPRLVVGFLISAPLFFWRALRAGDDRPPV